MDDPDIKFQNKRFDEERNRWEIERLNVSSGESDILNFPSEKELDDFLDKGICNNGEEDLSLTLEQKNKAIDCWNSGKIDLKDISKAVFGPDFDGRSKRTKALKIFLTEKGIVPKVAHRYEKKGDLFSLTEEHKEYIRNNGSSMTPIEIAKTLFRPDISIGDTETRKVLEFYKTLDPSQQYSSEDELNDLEGKSYRPPKTHEQAINKIFKYRITQEKLDKEKVRIQKQLDALIRYLHTYRFIHLMDSYSKVSDKKLFESSFIAYTYDKIDLTSEDLDLYMNVCMDKINLERVEKQISDLSEMFKATDDEGKKLSMTVVEQIGKFYTERNNVSKRIENTLSTLTGERSKRLEGIGKANVSILDLVEVWKNEEDRKRIIALAEIRQKKLESEVGRLESLEDLKFQIWGLGKDEAITSI